MLIDELRTLLPRVFPPGPTYEVSDVLPLVEGSEYRNDVAHCPPAPVHYCEYNSAHGQRTLVSTTQDVSAVERMSLPDDFSPVHTYHHFIWARVNGRLALCGAALSGFDVEHKKTCVGMASPEQLWEIAGMMALDHNLGKIAAAGLCIGSIREGDPISIQFMLWALLGCRNVETVTVPVSARRIKEANRTRQPRPTPYQIIRLTRPVVTRPEGDGETTEERSKQRFHLVRGHFKNLTHPRFKEPGLYWWPAHWRGDETLGTVPQRYKVKP